METRHDGDPSRWRPVTMQYDHDEVGITATSYVIEVGNSGKYVIRVISDDTDVFVLLVYWVCRKDRLC